MGSFSAWHWVVVALVILVLFGRGKISETMGDFGKGIRSFKQGVSEAESTSEFEPVGHLPAAVQTPPNRTVGAFPDY